MIDIRQYLHDSLCTTTESMISYRINLAEALEQQCSNVGYIIEQKEKFNDFVTEIVTGNLNRFNFNEDEIRKQFGFTTENKCKLYLDLIFYVAGLQVGANSDKHNIRQINDYAENMDYGFLLSYTISKEKTAKLIQQMRASDILKESHSFSGDRNYLYLLCSKELRPGMSDKEIIGLINSNNDGDYIELPGYVSLISWMLIREKRYDQWTRLLNKLKYFPLQGALINDIRTLDSFISILEEIKRQSIAHRNVLLYLLREKYFHIIVNLPKTLRRNAEYFSNRSKKYREMCKEDVTNWEANITDNSKDVFGYFSSKLKYSDCSEWYSRKQRQYANGNKLFIQEEQEAINIIGRVLSGITDPKKWSCETADLGTLFYYINQTETIQITKYRSKILIQALHDRLYSDRSDANLNVNEESFNILRLSYQCLLKSGLNAIDLLEVNRHNSEGYGSDYQMAIQTANGDSFWLAMLLLGAGEEENAELFKEYVSVMLRYSLNSSNFLSYYAFPLYIAELVFSQVFTKFKDDFEANIINNISDLYVVLSTLIANQGKMSDMNKNLLEKRIESEWNFEKNLLKRSRTIDVQFIENYITEIMTTD